MNKSWAISLAVIVLSLFVVRLTDQTNYYEIQSSYDTSFSGATFNNSPVLPPAYIAEIPLPPKVLGDSTAEKTIYVDLTNQRLYAYEGTILLQLSFYRKWVAHPLAPSGSLTFRFIKMSGGSVALHTYYYLPNVPYTMFFGNNQIPASRGFSLHGTYWHNNFGHPMSHGCVNMKISEAGVIYNWADPKLPEGKNSGVATKDNPGTQVIIFGTAPKS
jgi:lipoprotein-anchoring transpeptidase ErfK/SrfK